MVDYISSGNFKNMFKGKCTNYYKCKTLEFVIEAEFIVLIGFNNIYFYVQMNIELDNKLKKCISLKAFNINF